MEITNVDVNVTLNNHNLSEREIKIIEVLFLNFCAQTNAQVTGDGMALNPLEKTEKDSIFYFQLAWQSSISSENYTEIQEGVKRRINGAVMMCGLPEVVINFKEKVSIVK